MGIRTGTTNIRIVKSSPIFHNAMVQTMEQDTDELTKLQSQCRSFLKKSWDVVAPGYDIRNKQDAQDVIADVLKKKLYSTEDWTDGGVIFERLPGKIGAYQRHNTFAFRCWRKGQKEISIVSGKAELTKQDYDLSTGRYNYKLEFSQLQPIPPEIQKQLHAKAKKPVIFDPVKVITQQEKQQLTDFDELMATGQSIEIVDKTYNRVSINRAFGERSLQLYVKDKIFNDVNSMNMVKIKFLGYGQDENNLVSKRFAYDVSERFVWLEFYRSHQKKETARRVCLQLKDKPGTSNGNNSYHIISSKKI